MIGQNKQKYIFDEIILAFQKQTTYRFIRSLINLYVVFLIKFSGLHNYLALVYINEFCIVFCDNNQTFQKNKISVEISIKI